MEKGEAMNDEAKKQLEAMLETWGVFSVCKHIARWADSVGDGDEEDYRRTAVEMCKEIDGSMDDFEEGI